MKAIKFNTGRTYTPEGQIVIAYQVGEPDHDEEFGMTFLTVRFIDLSRMVSGEVGVTELSERAVMHMYDHGSYKGVYISDEEKAQAIAAAG
jgi:hypothetical protein